MHADPTQLSIAPTIRELTPGLRIHAVVLTGGRVGVGHRELDTLRTRVSTVLRQRLSARNDPLATPEAQAFLPLLHGCGESPPRGLTEVQRRIRGLLRKEPFPVENDVVDAVLLLGLFYGIPTAAFDIAEITPPLRLDVLPTGRRETEGSAAVLEPVLADERRTLFGLVGGVYAAPVTEATRDFLVVLLDPGVSGGLPPDRTAHRVENWLAALTGARAVRSALIT